jgi:hypothetical protein
VAASIRRSLAQEGAERSALVRRARGAPSVPTRHRARDRARRGLRRTVMDRAIVVTGAYKASAGPPPTSSPQEGRS